MRLKVPVNKAGAGGSWLSPHAEGSKLHTENTHPLSRDGAETVAAWQPLWPLISRGGEWPRWSSLVEFVTPTLGEQDKEVALPAAEEGSRTREGYSPPRVSLLQKPNP